MNRNILTAGIGVVAVLAVVGGTASATIIGTATQSSSQAANDQQLANSSTATGNIIVLNPAASAASGTQGSSNTLINAQSVGTAGGRDNFISPTGAGPSQSSKQAVNLEQGSDNGAIGLQGSTNTLGNSQIVGGDQSCVPPLPVGATPCLASTIIGSPSQGNAQAVNASQVADGGVTTGDIIVGASFSINAPAGTIVQSGNNPISSSQIVLG